MQESFSFDFPPSPQKTCACMALLAYMHEIKIISSFLLLIVVIFVVIDICMVTQWPRNVYLVISYAMIPAQEKLVVIIKVPV